MLDFVALVALVVVAGTAEEGVHVSPAGHGVVAGCAAGMHVSPAGHGEAIAPVAEKRKAEATTGSNAGIFTVILPFNPLFLMIKLNFNKKLAACSNYKHIRSTLFFMFFTCCLGFIWCRVSIRRPPNQELFGHDHKTECIILSCGLLPVYR